jgi:hypothetical protein
MNRNESLKEVFIKVLYYCFFRFNAVVLVSTVVVFISVTVGLIDYNLVSFCRLIFVVFFLVLFFRKEDIIRFYRIFASFIEFVSRISLIRLFLALCISLYCLLIENIFRTYLIILFSFGIAFAYDMIVKDKLLIFSLIFTISYQLAVAIIRSTDAENPSPVSIMMNYLLNGFVFDEVDLKSGKTLVFNWMNLPFLFFFIGEINKRNVYGSSKKISGDRYFHSSVLARMPFLPFFKQAILKTAHYLEHPTPKATLVIFGAVGAGSVVLNSFLQFRQHASTMQVHDSAMRAATAAIKADEAKLEANKAIENYYTHKMKDLKNTPPGIKAKE